MSTHGEVTKEQQQARREEFVDSSEVHSGEEAEARGGECVHAIKEPEVGSPHFMQREDAEDKTTEESKHAGEIVDAVHVPRENTDPHAFLRRPLDAFREAMQCEQREAHGPERAMRVKLALEIESEAREKERCTREGQKAQHDGHESGPAKRNTQ